MTHLTITSTTIPAAQAPSETEKPAKSIWKKLTNMVWRYTEKNAEADITSYRGIL